MKGSGRSFAVAKWLPLHERRNNVKQYCAKNNEAFDPVVLVDGESVTYTSTSVVPANYNRLYFIWSDQWPQGFQDRFTDSPLVVSSLWGCTSAIAGNLSRLISTRASYGGNLELRLEWIMAHHLVTTVWPVLYLIQYNELITASMCGPYMSPPSSISG